MKEISKTQIDKAKDIGVVIPIYIYIYNLIEYSDSCSKAYGSLWHRNEPSAATVNSGSIASIIR